MKKDLDISYEQDGYHYGIELTASGSAILPEIVTDPSYTGLAGEALVDALVEQGVVREVRRYRDGVKKDGPNGEPAVEFLSVEADPVEIYQEELSIHKDPKTWFVRGEPKPDQAPDKNPQWHIQPTAKEDALFARVMEEWYLDGEPKPDARPVKDFKWSIDEEPQPDVAPVQKSSPKPPKR